jgi:hypothetical protein
MLKIDILAVDGSSAHAMRSALESYGSSVLIHWIGAANDIVSYLESDSLFGTHLIIDCHGDDGSMHLPSLDESIEQLQKYHRMLTANDLSEIRLSKWRVVLNTGCTMGSAEYAQAFLKAGTQNYIGASGYPEGPPVFTYTAMLFYNLICRKMSVTDAHKQAAGIDEETAIFQLFQNF